MIPFIHFTGDCNSAIELYKTAFNAKLLEIRRFGEMPSNPNFPPIPEAQKDLILNALLEINGSQLRVADNMRQSITKGNNMSLIVDFKDEAAAKSAWSTLASEGTVVMDLQPTFFAKLHGTLVDKFGITWQFNYI